MPCDLPVWRWQLEMQAELKWWPHVWGIAPTNANATLSWSAPFKRPESHRHCLHNLKAILIAAIHLRTSPTKTHQKRNSYCTAKAVRRSHWAMHFDLQRGGCHSDLAFNHFLDDQFTIRFFRYGHARRLQCKLETLQNHWEYMENKGKHIARQRIYSYYCKLRFVRPLSMSIRGQHQCLYACRFGIDMRVLMHLYMHVLSSLYTLLIKLFLNGFGRVMSGSPLVLSAVEALWRDSYHVSTASTVSWPIRTHRDHGPTPVLGM